MAELAAATRTSNRTTYSCIRCAERKVKCDRQRPCNACVKHGVDFVYSPSKPPGARKKYKRVKVQVLADRLDQYEALLQKHGIDRNELQATKDEQLPIRDSQEGMAYNQLTTPSSLETEFPQDKSLYQYKPHLEYVENSLWRRVVEESLDSENIIHQSDTSSDTGESDGEHSFVFSTPLSSRHKFQLPPPDVMQQLWEIYVDNFDPLTKIFHVPTLRPAVEKAIKSGKTLPRNFEALMFAIFGASILTLTDKECQQRFGKTRHSMLLRYASATEAALSRAKFMSTTSIFVLQALLIHLYSVRDIYEPRTVWTLTGVAVRIAQGMGFDRDGTARGLSPFDTEIRRRVWWQLKSHDFRTAELCGLAKFRDIDTGSDSTKWPSNIGDNDLHPGITSLDIAPTGLTDASFVAFKFEMTKFAATRITGFRNLGKDPSQWNLDTPDNDKLETKASIETLRDVLEAKYLRYCDPSHPLHLMLLLVGRYAMNIVTFLTHHPRRWATMEHVPLAERTLIWDGSIKLLEQYSMMLSNPLIRQFAWHAPYFQQWHAFIHVLDTLRAEPLREDASKSWQLVENIYEDTPNLVLDMKKPIHVAIGNLYLKAYGAREASLLRNNMYSPPTPRFISNLRQHREAKMLKRKARMAKLQESTKDDSSGLHLPQARPEGLVLQQSKSSTQPIFGQFDATTEINPFHLFDELKDGSRNEFFMDLDFALPDDYNMDNYVPDPINWEQWDTWLVDSNSICTSAN